MLNKIKKITDWSINYPRTVIWINIGFACVFLLLVALPFIFSTVSLPKVKIDTDPENMLSSSEPVRVFHNKMKQKFNLYDIVVLGLVNQKHPQGIFNQESLTKIYQLTEYAKTLEGVISKEIISPSTVDSIEASGKGIVNFHWLMKHPPKNDLEAQKVYQQAARIPFLNGTLVSEDGQALALYIPIASKNLSYQISTALKKKAQELKIQDSIFVTGLPVAQDQFGIEMFKQMAVSAPLAMLFIFILMYLFFKNIRLIISPMIIAGLSVIITMGLLIITGNTIHIMSSMIPIFIMPIAVLDAVHILSDFFDIYHRYDDNKKAIQHVMGELFTPMLYTSITTVVGFASLAFTSIPPVQVFGIFVALGVLFAWLSTVTFIPAFVMILKNESLVNFGLKKGAHDRSLTANFLHSFGHKIHDYYKPILISLLALVVVAYYGIQQININDNPVKWFAKTHEIRVADQVLNQRFAGTYMGYLVLDGALTKDEILALVKKSTLPTNLGGNDKNQIINHLYDWADNQPNPEQYYGKIEQLEKKLQVFKNPIVLNYIEQLQNYLLTTGVVGKSNSIVDVIKTVHRDLYEGQEKAFTIPATDAAVAQTLITYQNSHRPGDLWHFVTNDYMKANLWIQLKSGDNADMQKVIDSIKHFQKIHPTPFNIKTKWFGMTYINVVWQEKMVSGMLKSFLGSFLIVLLLMTLLFKSIAWGTLAMLPLTITIGAIYGIIGFLGKDYDMPIAVLSSLSLGLAIDYAIHFLARAKELRKSHQNWRSTIYPLFGEPARAIFRNVMVISIGFVPLLLAPLVPYQTVGIFISAILFFAGGITLAILPAAMTLTSRWIFADRNENKFSLETKIAVFLIIIGIITQNFLM